MKISKNNVALLACFFVLESALAQSIAVVNKDGKLIVKQNAKILLSGGIGLKEGSTEQLRVENVVKDNVALFTVQSAKNIGRSAFAGVFFDDIPKLKQGLTIWRYKPWNSWTKPIAISNATEMESWDVQFFYWQYIDGTYGAAVPLSGNGFRTTLGSNLDKWGSKAVSYAPNENQTIPALAVAFGKDPFELFKRIYSTALAAIGKEENLVAKKKMPLPFEYIGWCTWNASDNGKNLDEAHIIKSVKTFTDHKFPLGWVLIDDGWFQHNQQQLTSLKPDPAKFPGGFKPVVNRLKNEFGIKYTGLWHAFNGYWNGIDPDSELGKVYKGELFSWTQKQSPTDDDSAPKKTYHFIKPNSDSLKAFYSTWHHYMKTEGFDFIKVDNQLVPEKMAVDNYPIFDLSAAMHKALYASAEANFNGAVLNCMDMTADAYLNFGSSAVARSVEDYFPYEKGENYNLQKGNAPAHIVQAIYNSTYFSQMVYPDFDMFQSHNPNAISHAIARTINNGPIYLTDNPGEQNFELLNRIVYSDGRIIKSDTPLLPAEDCLFQVQKPQLFKAFSKVGDKGLLGLWNAADANTVTGKFKALDVYGMKGERFAIYEYFSQQLRLAKKSESFNISLPRLGYQLQYVVPIKNNFAAFGLINKYNAPATILNEKWVGAKRIEIQLYEGGTFKAYANSAPKKVLVNGKAETFTFEKNLILCAIDTDLKKPVVVVEW
jgi:hypothetical protein